MRHTKIVATLGPASSNEQTIAALIEAGVNVFRLNFSHGDHAFHARLIGIIRRMSKDKEQPIGILQDLCGPKIRVAALPNSEPLLINPGETLKIVEFAGQAVGENTIAVSLPRLAETVQVGEPIRIDDGRFELVVSSIDRAKKVVDCQVVHGGLVKPKKGVNFPRTKLNVPTMTDKDRADLKFGLEHGVDFVAMSFVRHESDIEALRGRLRDSYGAVKILAKIEKHEAVTRILKILDVVDGIMVARGDLGVEMPAEEVPAIQKSLILDAVRKDRFVIIATQMLESMTNDPTPTRAEVSDVANAIYDGTDAVMLSGETASGKYPIESVKMMAKIANSADRMISKGLHEAQLHSDIDQTTYADALCHAAYSLCKATKASTVITYTGSWRTALFMSRYRPCLNIIGATTNQKAFRQMAILRAVQPITIPPVDTVRDLTVSTEKALVSLGFASQGESVVHVGGANLAARSNINSIRIRNICED